MTNIEIPLEKDRKGWYRFFEIMPGALSWLMLAMPLILSFISAKLAAFFILVYLIVIFVRAIAGGVRVMQGYRAMRQHQALDWVRLLDDIENGPKQDGVQLPKWHYENLKRYESKEGKIKPSELIHAIIIATVNESREVLEPTIKSIIDSRYNMDQVVLVIAYEGRAGAATEKRVKELISLYQGNFKHAMAVKHPADIPGEIIGKGGNVTCAGRALQKYLEKEKIDPLKVVVTTLDADNRPDLQYLPALSYLYVICPDPIRVSIQPISMYTNNIWDAPAPMRVLATGNSFFHIVQSHRPHMLRNFSSHAQGMESLLRTNFWSVRTIVEDGHQFWRCYFAFDGNYRVLPLYLPIYQDAVLTDSYIKTIKAQFIQLRRWTWGASDIAYVISKGFFTKNKVPKLDLFTKTARLTEGHITWAVGPLLSLFAGFVPVMFSPDSFAANELPIVVSRIQSIALVGVLAMVFICLKTLPPRPERYKRHRTLVMILQWLYLPVTTIAYNSLAALNSQTRLMFRLYLGKFDVTEKAVVTQSGKKTSTRADTT